MPPTNPAELREGVARVIDPDAWRLFDLAKERPDIAALDAGRRAIGMVAFADRCEPSLAKADALLSLLEREPVPEVDRERVEKIAARLDTFARFSRDTRADLAANDQPLYAIDHQIAEAVKDATALRNLLAQHVPTGGAGWRDISTAPKDGTRVLCAWRNGDMCTATLFEKTVRAWINPPHFWQPLPQPPQENADAVST